MEICTCILVVEFTARIKLYLTLPAQYYYESDKFLRPTVTSAQQLVQYAHNIDNTIFSKPAVTIETRGGVCPESTMHSKFRRRGVYARVLYY